MCLKRKHLAAVAAVVSAMGFLGIGSALSAGAAGQSVTYYACLKNGNLSNVGAAAPASCPGNDAMVISWNSLGPQGPTGPAGPSKAPS